MKTICPCPRRALRLALPGALLALPMAVWAVEPADFKLGPVYVAPTLDVETRYVDNVLRTPSSLEYSSWVLDTLPKVQAWLQSGVNTYSLSYQLQDFRYSSSKDDDFTDHQVNLDINHQFNGRNRLELHALYFDGHEERGTGLAEGRLAEGADRPVELQKTRFEGIYTYGGRDTRGRLDLGYRYYEPDYQNFRAFTRFRDRDEDTFFSTFYWRVRPRTDLLAEVRYTDVSYDEVRRADRLGSYDSDEYSYFLGVKWEATAKTSGSLRLGWYDREFDNGLRADEDGFSWEVDVDYKLRSYSVLNLGTRRFSQETNGIGDFIDTQEYSLAWDHDWSGRASTHVKVLYADDDYQSSGFARRDDDRWFGEARYTYKLRRWLDLGGGYRYEDRDSNAINLDYTRNAYFIEATLSL